MGAADSIGYYLVPEAKGVGYCEVKATDVARLVSQRAKEKGKPALVHLSQETFHDGALTADTVHLVDINWTSLHTLHRLLS
jgi:hypothetical protein